MVYHIAIVEDEQAAETDLINYLCLWAKKKEISFEFTIFHCAEDLLERYSHRFDIIFMDIELGEYSMNGMRAAKKIRELDDVVLLVFVTNIKKFVVRVYEVDAINYIIKPINYYGLAMTLERCLSKLHLQENHSVMIKVENGVMCMQPERIHYIEIMKHDLIFHTSDGTICSYGSLNEWEQKLAPYHFARASASVLVNLRSVRKVSKDDVYIDDAIVRISRSKKKTFLTLMAEFFGERL